MPYYMLQASYTPEAWATLVQNPQDRREVFRALFEGSGGSLHGSWLSFGDYDVVLIVEAQDNIWAAASSIVASAGGAVKAVKTTPLLTWEEGVEAMRAAGGIAYRPPGD